MARDYNDRDRGNFQRDRSMWDRTGDEVRSWFGDEEAERRRRLDDMYANRMENQDRDRGYRNYPGEGRGRQESGDQEFERDYDATYRGGGQTPSGFSRTGGPGYRRDYGQGRQGYDRMDQGYDRMGQESGRYGAWEGPQHDSGHFRRRNLQQQSGYYGRDAHEESFAGRGPSGYRRSADRIREDLNEALTWDARLDASDIEVKVEENIVTLTGSVRDRHSKRRAEDLAESIRGVEDVRNNLNISSSSSGKGSQGMGGQEHNSGSHNPGSQTIGQHNLNQHNSGQQNSAQRNSGQGGSPGEKPRS